MKRTPAKATGRLAPECLPGPEIPFEPMASSESYADLIDEVAAVEAAIANTSPTRIPIKNVVCGYMALRASGCTSFLSDLTDAVREDEPIPPLVARKVGELYEVLDGEYRLQAFRAAGAQEIPVIVVACSDACARICRLRANVAHGLPVRRADIRAYTAMCFKATPALLDDLIERKRSLRDLAALFRVSKSTIDRVKDDLLGVRKEANGTSEPTTKEDKSTEAKTPDNLVPREPAAPAGSEAFLKQAISLPKRTDRERSSPKSKRKPESGGNVDLNRACAQIVALTDKLAALLCVQPEDVLAAAREHLAHERHRNQPEVAA